MRVKSISWEKNAVTCRWCGLRKGTFLAWFFCPSPVQEFVFMAYLCTIIFLHKHFARILFFVTFLSAQLFFCYFALHIFFFFSNHFSNGPSLSPVSRQEQSVGSIYRQRLCLRVPYLDEWVMGRVVRTRGGRGGWGWELTTPPRFLHPIWRPETRSMASENAV